MFSYKSMEPKNNNKLAEKAKNTGRVLEETIEKVSDEMKLGLPPHGQLPFPARVTIFLALLSGIAIIGSVFADSFTVRQTSVGLYLLRLAMGFALVVTAHGLNRRRRWGVWLFGLIALVSIFRSPFFGLLPAIVFIYLYIIKRHFRPTYEFRLLGIKIGI